MANSLFKKARIPLARMASVLEREQENYVRNNHKPKLEEITAPLATPYEFQINKGKIKGDPVAQIAPKHKQIQRRQGVANSGTIDAYELFFYLNDGTSTRHAVMPKGYQSETVPNSTVTSSRANNRGAIYVNKNTINKAGLEPRNWLALVEEEFQPNFVRVINRKIAAFLRRNS